MKHPASQHLFAYWNELRAGRAAPERSEIDPAAVRSILADMLMIDVEPQADGQRPAFPIRLSGTRVNALFGFDLKQRCLSTLWRLKDRADVGALLMAVLDGTQPAVAGIEAAPPGEGSLALELLLLPLRHKGKTHARLLGTLSPVAVPSWLGLQGVAPLALGSHRIIDPHALRAPATFRSLAGSRDPGQRHGPFIIYQGGRL